MALLFSVFTPKDIDCGFAWHFPTPELDFI